MKRECNSCISVYRRLNYLNSFCASLRSIQYLQLKTRINSKISFIINSNVNPFVYTCIKIKKNDYIFWLIGSTLQVLLWPLWLQLEHLDELLNSPIDVILCFSFQVFLTWCLTERGNIFMTSSSILQSKWIPTGRTLPNIMFLYNKTQLHKNRYLN